MARPRDEQLRARLIETATAAFAQHGYAGSSLDRIAERAGVTKGGVYFHFAGKEELFFAVVDHWRQRRRRALSVPDVGAAGAAEALRQFLTRYLAFHFDAPEAAHLLRVLATELRGGFTARLREDDRQEQRWLRASIRELLVQGHDGSLFVDDPAFAAFQLAATVTGVLEQWHSAPADVEVFCHAEQLARALVARLATGSQGAVAGSAAGEFEFRPPTGA
ncbi:MAG TPA: TetR family transcriptional regulator [Planctomycetota bacterium]|nr:TetR family transcriptional regulator [Planctomycetota bacterium]